MEPLAFDVPTLGPADADLVSAPVPPRARLADLTGLGRLFLMSAAVWTGAGLVFALQRAAMNALRAHAGAPRPFLMLLAEELVSWWPCALLTPPVVAATFRARASVPSLGRTLAFHAAGATVFVVAAGALMGLAEGLLPWAPADGGPLRDAAWGALRYLGADLLLYALIVAGAAAAA